jgi:formylglycine-generating enzyme required for sulfatase activity
MTVINSLKIIMLLIFSFIAINSLILCSQAEREFDVSEISPTEMTLIAGGEFQMGKNGEGDHSPVHKIITDSFYIDKYEVTNAQYYKFCLETERKLPEYWGLEKYHCGLDYPNHPVVGINWRDAEAYAIWVGKRLPTEAEWEYAARGGLVDKNYPKGDEIDSSQGSFTIKGVTAGSQPVGSYPANGFGLHDMVGNVNEWVADYYDGGYYEISPGENPTGPEDGRFKVIRGGGWHSGAYCCRVYYRNALPPNWLDINVGFRCAKDLRPVEEGK